MATKKNKLRTSARPIELDADEAAAVNGGVFGLTTNPHPIFGVMVNPNPPANPNPPVFGVVVKPKHHHHHHR